MIQSILLKGFSGGPWEFLAGPVENSRGRFVPFFGFPTAPLFVKGLLEFYKEGQEGVV